MSLMMSSQVLSTSIRRSRRPVSFETASVKRLCNWFISLTYEFTDGSRQAKFGFVAFSDPEDFLKAWKEMDGMFFSVPLDCLTKFRLVSL